jgi:hypothetical protein
MKLSIHSKLGRAVVVGAAAAGLVVPAAQAAEPDAVDRALLNVRSGVVVVDDPADRALFSASGIRTTHRVAPVAADPADRAMFTSGHSRMALRRVPTPDDPADRALFNRLGLPTAPATLPATMATPDALDRALISRPEQRPGAGGLAAPSVGDTRGFAVAWSSVGLGAAMGVALALLAGAALLVLGRARLAGGHSR